MPTREIKIVINGQDNASGVLSKFGGALGGIATVAGGILSAQVLTRIASGIASIGREALDEVAAFENLTLSLESLVAKEIKNTGAAQDMTSALALAGPKAQELLGWIEQLAIVSPFDQEGVAVAFRTALAYGFTTDQAKELTTGMINFASATGQPVSVMNQMALALGQVQAKGKLAGQEILQLVNAGVPVNEILGEMGFTLDDVSKGLVSAEDFIAAFNQTMDEDFSGAAARGSETVSGLLNSLGDLKAIGLRELFTGIIEPLKEPLQLFVDLLNNDETRAAIRGFGERIGELIAPVANLLSILIDAGPNSIEFREALSGIIPEGVGTVVENFKAAWAGVVAIFQDPEVVAAFEQVKEALVTLISAFVEDAPLFEEAGKSMFQTLLDTILTVLPEILTNVAESLESIAEFWNEHGETIIETATFIWNFLVGFIGGAIALISGIIASVLALINANWEEAWNAIHDAALVFWESVLDVFGTNMETVRANFETWLFDLLWGIVTWAIDTGKAISQWWEDVKTGFTDTFNAVMDTIVTWVADTVATITGWVESVLAILDLYDTLLSVGENIIGGLWQGLKNKWASMISWFENKVAEFLETFGDYFKFGSESKVFIKHGEDIAGGLQLGFDRGMVGVEASFASAGARMTNAAAVGQQNVQHYRPVTIYGGLHAPNVRNAESFLEEMQRITIPG